MFWKAFFCGDRLKIFCEDLFFFFFGDRLKKFCKDLFFFLGEHLRLCPWSLALASSIPVLGLESVCPRKGCSWPWPRIFFVSLALASSLVSSTPPLVMQPCKLSNIIISNYHCTGTASGLFWTLAKGSIAKGCILDFCILDFCAFWTSAKGCIWLILDFSLHNCKIS